VPDNSPRLLNIYCDGGSRGNPGPAASAFVVMGPLREVIHKEGVYLGISTNNVAEYTAVLISLKWLSNLIVSHPEIASVNYYLDSLLVTSQILVKYKVKDLRLKNLNQEIVLMLKHLSFINFNFHNIPRSQNALADGQVNQILDNKVI